jgi:hypothetical protein
MNGGAVTAMSLGVDAYSDDRQRSVSAGASGEVMLSTSGKAEVLSDNVRSVGDLLTSDPRQLRDLFRG